MKTLRHLSLALTLLLFAGTASAITWSPTDVESTTGDVNTIDLSTEGTGSFGIFDTGSLPSAGGLPDLTIASVDRVTFSLLGDNTWEIENLAGDTFNLGTSFNFNFAYYDGANWLEELASLELAADSNIWSLTWGTGIELQAIDVAPIPVPPAVVLLVSGLLALGGLGKPNRG